MVRIVCSGYKTVIYGKKKAEFGIHGLVFSFSSLSNVFVESRNIRLKQWHWCNGEVAVSRGHPEGLGDGYRPTSGPWSSGEVTAVLTWKGVKSEGVWIRRRGEGPPWRGGHGRGGGGGGDGEPSQQRSGPKTPFGQNCKFWKKKG